MLGLGGNISASAPVGASGATQPSREQLVFTYDLENHSGLNCTVTYGEAIGGYTNLLKSEDTSTSVYMGPRLEDNFQYLTGDIIRIEYYIPSTNTNINSLGRVYSSELGIMINQERSNVTDELISDDFVVNVSAVSSQITVYFTTYDSVSVQSSDVITNDLAYIKSAKVYRVS